MSSRADVQNRLVASGLISSEVTAELALYDGLSPSAQALYQDWMEEVSNADIATQVRSGNPARVPPIYTHDTEGNPPATSSALVGKAFVVAYDAATRPAGVSVVRWTTAAQPASPQTDDEWMKPSDSTFQRWNGTAWVTVNKAANNATYPTVLGLAPSGDTTGVTDLAAINAAIVASAGRAVWLNAGDWYVNGAINCANASGLLIVGAGRGRTVIHPAGGSTVSSIFTHTGAVNGLTIRDLTVQGAAVDDATSPRRSRTFSGTQVNRAFNFNGSLVPASGNPVVSNVRLDNIEAIGTSTLPVLLAGVTGDARVVNSRFYNCMDTGFIFCDDAVFIGNEVHRSADNGVSLSRGNSRVVCVGNTFDNCCYWAVWVAGFDTDVGPTDITVTGNVGTHLGYGGVCADLAPQHFTIAGNTFRDILRGPSDGATDIYGVGVYVSGFGDPTAPTSLAQNFTITGNTIIDAQRGGILVRGCKNGGIYGNTIIRPGTQFLSDGSTTVTTGNAGQNFGVAADATYSTTVSNVDVEANVVIDDRGTPYLNNAIYTGSATTMWGNNNRAVGNRLQLADSAKTYSGGQQTYSGALVSTGGFRVGSDTGTSGLGVQVNGPAGQTRETFYTTAGSRRWAWQATSTAEGGSNAGSDMQLVAYADAGTSLGTALTLIRSTQGLRHENKPLGFYGTTPAAKQTVTGSRGGNAALASLLTALATLGLITDSSSA